MHGEESSDSTKGPWQGEQESAYLRGAALFAHSSDAIIDIDITGVITAFNPAAELQLGYHAADVVGRPVGILLPDRTSEEIAELLSSLVGKSDVEPYSTNYRHPDGRVLELSVTAVPLVYPDGTAVGLTVILRDLTALHCSQAALSESEARYRTMIESANEGIGVLDSEARLTFVNVRFAEMFGYTVEEMIGLQLVDLAFSEDEDEVAEMMSRRREGLAENAENRWKRKDGSTLWTMKATAPLFDEAGAFMGAVAFHTDVTDRMRAETALRTSEARLRSYFDYSPVGILLVNRDSVIVNVNPALSSITGYEADELLGASLHALLGPDHLARIEENKERFGALLSGELPSFNFERPIVTKDGRSVWLEVSISLMRDEHGNPLEFVAVVQDVTPRKDAERAKDEFISVTSHELRTPLTSIRGALGLLAGGAVGDLPDSAQRMLEIAVQSTDRLIRLINDILDIERLGSGKVPLSVQECEVAGLISRTVEEIRGAADAAEVTVHVGSVEGKIWADPDRVIQTLTNLVGNAIKFSPPSGIVTVSTQEEKDYIRFDVRDNGPGIPADKLETVFGRFQQVDSTDARAKGGTGLGLAICRTIVEQHGGLIWAESVLGEGSTFSFTLPVVRNNGENVSDEHSSEPGVLVCDDDAAIREVVKTMLEASGYRVWTAASGEEALKVAQARHPDVIVLDLLLPGIDGQKTANVLKGQKETADIPIVVLSVLTAEQMPVEDVASRLGKPIDEDLLLSALRRGLGEHHLQALVVEDDPQLSEVLEVTLARHGLKVRRAGSGQEAIRLGRAFAPDLLVLDLALPGGDGFSVVEWMREQQWLSTVPVLVYSAFDLDDSDRNRLRLGETRFLTKGRTPPELFEANIEELLDWISKKASRSR